MDEESFISQQQFQLINETEAKFILEHGEKQLKDILDTSLLIVSRSATLLTIAVGLIVALSGFWIKRSDDNEHLWEQALFVTIWGLWLNFSDDFHAIPKLYSTFLFNSRCVACRFL